MPKRTKKKPVRFTRCTILRTFKVTHTTMSMTGKKPTKKPWSEIVTGPCDTPLFTAGEETTGICNSCRKGWSVKNNHFATEEERIRATGSNL